MMTDFIILALATFRISSLLAYEEGPYGIFSQIRYLAGVRYNVISEPEYPTELSKGIVCGWCNSVWVGIGFAILYLITKPVAVGIAFPFALSAVAILLHTITRHE